MALPLTIESYRKSRRERGQFRVEHAEAGCVVRGGWRYDNIILTLINVGTPTVSITGYDLRVYEGWGNILLRRNPVVYVGNGWRVPREAEFFTLSLADGMSPPFPVKPGEPVRLEIHTPALWPDRNLRRVVAVVKLSHARNPLRITVTPNPWNYSDAEGVADMTARASSVIASVRTKAGLERLYSGYRER